MDTPEPGNLLLAVLPLRDVCLFPEASLSIVVARSGGLKALEVAGRTGRKVIALAQKDPINPTPNPKDLHLIGTIASVAEDMPLSDGTHRVELDGLQRAHALDLVGGSELLVTEVEALTEGDSEEEWGGAVEALARYLHAHSDLRSFLEEQRRSKEPMAWVNLACQHLPITSTARQRLLESDAPARCLRISRGLDALLRKEQGS